jgi:alkylation response protein AidB-like acyl-CoA dehydrogenase
MDFTLSAEQLALRTAVLEFSRKELAATGPEGKFPRDLWEQCANFGVQGMPFPTSYGGAGLDIVSVTAAMEALGYSCRDQGLLFSLHAHMWAVMMPINTFGSEEQKRRYLPKLADGSWVGAHGMSEPESGSDAYTLRSRAEKRDGSYVLNGTKTFVTNAPVADVLLVFASTNPARGKWGITGFILHRDTPGLRLGKPIEKMGLTTSPMGEVILEDCVVPESQRLGGEGQGPAIFAHSMGWERACILGSTVGAMQRQLETAIRYAKERKQFGRSIGDFQLIASKITDMKVRAETSRLLLYRAATAQLGRGDDAAMSAAIAKLYIAESAVQSSLDALQIHGGYGYTREYLVERDLRDMLGARLYSGTSEIQRMIIARYLGLSPIA